MSYISKVKKTLSNAFSDGADFLSTPLSGGFDAIQNIVDRPLVTTPFKFGVDAANFGQDILNSGQKYVGKPLAGSVLSSFLDNNGKFDTNPIEFAKNFGRGATYAGIPGLVRRGVESARNGDNPYTTGRNDYDKFKRSDAPTGLKVTADILTDPTTYLGAGAVKSLGNRVEKNAPKLAQYLLGTKEGGAATSRVARTLGGLVEGVGPRMTVPFAAGVGAGSQLAEYTDNPVLKTILPFAGGGLGLKAGGSRVVENARANVTSEGLPDARLPKKPQGITEEEFAAVKGPKDTRPVAPGTIDQKAPVPEEFVSLDGGLIARSPDGWVHMNPHTGVTIPVDNGRVLQEWQKSPENPDFRKVVETQPPSPSSAQTGVFNGTPSMADWEAAKANKIPNPSRSYKQDPAGSAETARFENMRNSNNPNPTVEQRTVRQQLQEIVWGNENQKMYNKKKTSGKWAQPTTKKRAFDLLKMNDPEILDRPATPDQVLELMNTSKTSKMEAYRNSIEQRGIDAQPEIQRNIDEMQAILRGDAPTPAQTAARTAQKELDGTSHPTSGEAPPRDPGIDQAIDEAMPIGKADSIKTTIVQDLQDFDKVVAAVPKFRFDNPIYQAVMTPLARIGNPALLMKTPIGRAIVGKVRQSLEAEKMTNIVMSSLDRYSGRTGLRDQFGKFGSIFKTDEDGIIKSIGEHWNKVFSNPEKYWDNLDDTQRAYITTVNQIISEIDALRVANGLPVLPKGVMDELWVPRVVKGVNGVEVVSPTNHKLDRYWDDATKAVKEGGVKYQDPRDTIKMYVYSTYRDVADKKFADHMTDLTLAMDKMVSPKIVGSLIEANKVRKELSLNKRTAEVEYRADPKNLDKKQIFLDTKKAFDEFDPIWQKAWDKYNKAQLKTTTQEYNRATVDGTRFGLGPGEIPADTFTIKHLGQRIVPVEDKKNLMKYVGIGGVLPKEEANIISKGFGAYGRNKRMFQAGFDAATPLTHNIALLLGTPREKYIWGKTVVAQTHAILSPKYREEMIAKNHDAVAEMSREGVDLLPSGYFEAAEHNAEIPKIYNATVGKIPVVNDIVNQAGKNSLGRFQAGMETAILKGRIEMWKMMRDGYEKKGKLPELAQLINNMTGGQDTRGLLVSSGQRNFESAFLAYSPKLMRSSLALMGMAMKPTTKEGQAALMALGSMAATTASVFYLGNLALNGEQEAWDSINPTSDPRKFMSIKGTDGNYYGIGSVYRRLARFAGNSGQAIHDGEYSNFWSPEPQKNPMMDLWLGSAAPGTGLTQNVIEATTGANANPYEELDGFDTPFGKVDNPMADVILNEMKSFLPFSITSLENGHNSSSNPLVNIMATMSDTDELMKGAANFNGLRVTPFTRAEETENRIRDLGYLKDDGTPALKIDDMTKEQRNQYYEIYPVERLTKNDNLNKFYTRLKEEEDSYVRDLNMVAGTVSNKADFRAYYQKRTSDKFAAIESIKKDFSTLPADRPNFQGSVMDYVNSRNSTPEDKAVSDYYSIANKIPLNPDGTINFDGISEAKIDFIKKLSPNVAAYVKRATTPDKTIGENELVTEYDLAKKVAVPYFNAADDIWAQLSPKSAFLSQFGTYDGFRKWIEKTAMENGVTTDTLTAVLGSKNKDIKAFNTVLTNYKKAIRLSNPTLEAVLVDWYGLEPANRIDYVNRQYGLPTGSPQVAQSIQRNSKVNSTANAVKYSTNLQRSGLRIQDTNPARRPIYSLN